MPVLETPAEAIELCGVPLAVMSDNGTPFVTTVRTMLSRFRRVPSRGSRHLLAELMATAA